MLLNDNEKIVWETCHKVEPINSFATKINLSNFIWGNSVTLVDRLKYVMMIRKKVANYREVWLEKKHLSSSIIIFLTRTHFLKLL